MPDHLTPTHSALFALSSVVLRFPWVVVSLFILLSASSLQFTINNLGVNTNVAELLSPDLPFQKNRLKLEATFPKSADTLLLVVEASTPENTAITTQLLIERLNKEPLFTSVYAPSSSDFFKRQAFLYLEPDELNNLSHDLTEAQPFVGHLAQNFSLKGLFSIINHAFKPKDTVLPMDINPLLTAINTSLEAQLLGNSHPVSWQRLILGKNSSLEKNRRLILAKPLLDFNQIMPAEEAFLKAREISQEFEQSIDEVSISITGEKALEHEELESVSQGAIFSGILSLTLVCITLYFALRSFKLLLITFTSLITGLILTAGFATISVGHLNLISIAFAVLYIGLGVDFAIHLCLRYRELIAEKQTNLNAIHGSIQSVGKSLILCAITTSIGFFAFIPTDYAGVSELGIISGAGMFIGLIVSLTLLPALLQVLPIKAIKQNKTKTPRLDYLATLPFRFSTGIRVAVIFLILAGSYFIGQLTFDSNPVNLRDPNSESVTTFNRLLQSLDDSPFAVETLADDLTQAVQLAKKFESLDSVKQAITIRNFVPDNQEDKLLIVEDLDLILGSQLGAFSSPIEHQENHQALLSFKDNIETVLALKTPHFDLVLLQKLHDNLDRFLAQTATTYSESEKELSLDLLGLLPFSMDLLNSALAATEFEIDDIPTSISEHWVSHNSLYRILIQPQYNLMDQEKLISFVDDVQTIDDRVTGLAVADQSSGKAVVKAFIQAFIGAIVAITLLLWIMLGNLKETLLVIGPLLLAGLLTGAFNVILDNPFNFANIIALPLLMGMGVDSGIHIVHRLAHRDESSDNLLRTSTARGVFYSSVTTFCSFTSLAFSPHVGTASMGLLLAIGIALTLLTTLIVLPAFSPQKTNSFN
ncbi:MAG TPA: hopanoid biosynthesis-associated RND transporter HpnN [Methylococcaceae bacterium]|jgi:hopanoid biosynthesis associated RND transporter like protein HpnN|nr:hopanoid biosynthesis-associated RND transporter HpnN [Methylococcaceae bacterium]